MSKYCSECGAEIPEGSKFCPNCGFASEASGGAVNQQTSALVTDGETKDATSKMMTAIKVMGATLAILIIIGLIFGGVEEDYPSSTPVPSTTSPQTSPPVHVDGGMSELGYMEEPEGSISITSDPSGASVCLDGAYRGTTPISLDNVVSGSHTIELTKSGCESKTLTVSLSAGGAENIWESLEPLTGSISISSNPSGSNVYLDSIYKGTTPTTISGVLPGSHTIRLEKNDYEDYLLESVSVTAGVTTPRTVDLILKPVLISCDVTVPTIGLTNYRLPELLVDYGGLTYSATFDINNPNQIPAYLYCIKYTIYMQNVSISEGTYSEPVSIPAMDRKLIKIQDEIVIPLWGPDIQIVVGALATGKVDTRLNGRVYFKDTEYGSLPSEPFDITLLGIPLR